MNEKARQLIMNYTLAKSEMRPPDISNYLPHLINNPTALFPAVKVSQGRSGGCKTCYNVAILLS